MHQTLTRDPAFCNFSDLAPILSVEIVHQTLTRDLALHDPAWFWVGLSQPRHQTLIRDKNLRNAEPEKALQVFLERYQTLIRDNALCTCAGRGPASLIMAASNAHTRSTFIRPSSIAFPPRKNKTRHQTLTHDNALCDLRQAYSIRADLAVSNAHTRS